MLHGLTVFGHVFAGIAIALLLCCAAVWWMLRRSLPRTRGTLRLPAQNGMPGAPIEIIRDRDAVPHVYAASARDAYFGQGFVHAQDRLWQMEFQRRVGQGRLSEILGENTLPMDRFLRTLGVYRAAQGDWEILPEKTKGYIEAYVAGVNAFLAGHSGKLPPEFLILRTRPEPWTGPDVLVWAKMLAWNLSANQGAETLRRDMVDAVGEQRAAELMPGYPEDGRATVELLPKGKGVHDEINDLVESVRSVMAVSNQTGEGLGSNNWVVDATKSATGSPVLANDPHLGTGIPCIWYLAHISGGDLDAIGATVPGLPSIVIGRNRSIAWGVTSMIPDTQDLFQERLTTSDGITFAQYQGENEPVQQITEIINIKGKPSVMHTVRVTRHGPLMTDAGQPDKPDAERDHFALRWTALDPADTTVSSFLELNEASDWQSFRDALRGFVTPPQNFVYADTLGNIGFYAPGRIPIRKSGDGSVPAQGWTGANEWIGSVPFDEMPQAYNPAEHWFATANNRTIAEGYAHFLGRDWAPPYRVLRIGQLLNEKAKLSLTDHEAIQADTVSTQAREILPDLLTLIDAETEIERNALAALTAWDCNMRTDSFAASIWAAWVRRLPRALLGNEMGEPLISAYECAFGHTGPYLAHALKHATAATSQPQRGDLTSAQGNALGPASRGDAVARAFREALADLKTRLGDDVSKWRWDRLHAVRFPHQPFTHVRPLKRFFDRKVAHGGDGSSVNPGPYMVDGDFAQDWAAMYRQIIDMSDLDSGRFIQAVGQSGHFLSRHYSDYLDDWQSVRYRPMRFTRKAVEDGCVATLRLEALTKVLGNAHMDGKSGRD
jgi:penicillin G amidase